MDKDKLLYLLLVLGTLLLIFGLSFNFKSTNYDIFFHLKTGEYIVKSKSIPKEDIFSYTAAGNEWVVHEYVPAIIFYFFYKNFGMQSLIVLKAVIVTLIFFLMFKFIEKKNNTYVALVLTVFTAIAIKFYTYIRPHIFFWLFLVILFFILEYERHYFLPILTLIWANFHSSVIIGLGIITIYLSERIIFKKKVKFIFLIIACFLTSLINPATYKIFLLPFKILNFSKYVIEWTPYRPNEFYFWLYSSFILIIALIFILNKKNIKIKHIVVFLIFAFLGFKSKRDIATSILVNVIIVQPYLSRISEKIKRTKNSDYFFIIMIVLLIVLSIAKLHAFNPLIPWRYLGESPIEFIKNNNIQGNMYNSYELGGPLIFMLYPDYKVFIDGRIDIYSKEVVDDYYSIRYGNNWQDLVKKYNISYFIIDNKADIGQLLLKSNYSLVFFDEYFSVYVDGTYKNLRSFKVINPYYGIDPKQNTDMIIEEMEYLLSLDPENINAYRNLGMVYYLEKKNNEKALHYFNKYLEKNPVDKEVSSLVKKIENE